MPTATMSTKGQIAIPAAVRTALCVEAGDRIEFIQVESGRFELVQDDQKQSAKATKLIESLTMDAPGYVGAYPL